VRLPKATAHPPPPKTGGRAKIPGGNNTQTPFLFAHPLGLRLFADRLQAKKGW